MAELISNTLPLPPIGLAATAGLTPVSVETPGAANRTLGLTSAASASSQVDLSGKGRLLSALSLFRSQLDVLQTASGDTSPAGILARAEGFVAAFDSLQQRLDSLQGLLGNLSDLTLPESLAQLLTAIDPGSTTSLEDLAGIGIALPTDLLAQTDTEALSLDPNTLLTAATVAPSETLATLTQATAAFLDQAAAAETTLADTSANVTPLATTIEPASTATVLEAGTNPTVLEVAAAPEFVVSLPVDVLSSDDQVSDLELALAAAGLETATPALPPTATAAVTPVTTPALAQETPELPVAAPPPAATAPIVTLPPTAAVPVIDAVAVADRGATAATQELQSLLADPRLRAINTNLFDPAFAALMAASHLEDFAWPSPWTDPRLLEADTPGPVSAATMVRAITDYREAASSPLLQGRPVHHV